MNTTKQMAESPRTTAIDVYVGVGSNIEPEVELRSGVEALRTEFGELQVSSVYRSAALGFDGDDFLNVVVRFQTLLAPDAVEARLDTIENSGGRGRNGGRFAPRALDCDLLMYGARIDARCRLPRDDVLHYPFVLGPLAEITPRLRHPLDGITIEEHWEQRRAAAQLQRICGIDDLPLPANAAAAVDGQDLSGHVGGIPGEV
jgi:2-amino-4-hydroxy-6-hydroxymethyldihydropteridine diphosphokinase